MKKYRKFIIIIGIITLIRFLIGYALPSFYINNLIYDDKLMVYQLSNLLDGKYLGAYGEATLIKGVVFPFFLYIVRSMNLSYSSVLTILYILSCMYFTKSLDKVIKNKKALIIIYSVLLFNPISLSSELFQRLYRNSLSGIELLFFLGIIVRLFLSENKIKKDIINYILLGITMSIMYMTREDNIWTIVILGLLILYKLIKTKNYKLMLLGSIPLILLYLNLNIVALINYKHYGIYTYNEIQKSSFKNTFKKILEIKDDKEIDQVSIPKTTLDKITNLKSFDIEKSELDRFYSLVADDNNEIYNGNIIWYYRQFTFREKKFKNGKEADKYFKKLGEDIDKLKVEKEYTFNSILLNRPTKNNLKQMPKSVIDIVWYTTSYKDIKTLTDTKSFKYDKKVKAFTKVHKNSHTTGKIVKENDKDYEMIRLIYMLLTIILSPISLVVYIINIKKKDNIRLVSTIMLISYLIILAGVSYTNVTAFPTNRYLCLGNIYIIQSIFICLNIYRIANSEEELRKVKKDA